MSKYNRKLAVGQLIGKPKLQIGSFVFEICKIQNGYFGFPFSVEGRSSEYHQNQSGSWSPISPYFNVVSGHHLDHENIINTLAGGGERLQSPEWCWGAAADPCLDTTRAHSAISIFCYFDFWFFYSIISSKITWLLQLHCFQYFWIIPDGVFLCGSLAMKMLSLTGWAV